MARLTLLFLVVCGILTKASAFRVVIDAGHGGHDRGAQVGPVYEKHLALDVARRLQRYLVKRGSAVTMTRATDQFVPLNERAEIGNRLGDAIFVSIHFNSSQGGADGIETFYHTEQSQTLAELVHFNIIHKADGRDRGVKNRGFLVIRKSTNPAILVEGGFITNGEERARCLAPEYRQKLAEAIGFAILRYRKGR